MRIPDIFVVPVDVVHQPMQVRQGWMTTDGAVLKSCQQVLPVKQEELHLPSLKNSGRLTHCRCRPEVFAAVGDPVGTRSIYC
jgi:hypothetical protein